MNNNSKIKITDLSGKIQKPELKPLSDAETSQIVGGSSSSESVDCPWCRIPRPGRPG